MTVFWSIVIFGLGMLTKTLLPWPAADDRVRAAWRWFANWLEKKVREGW